MQTQHGKSIKEHIARAKGALSRDQIVKSLNAFIKALELLSQVRLLGKEKFEVNVAVDDFLSLLNAHAHIDEYFSGKGIFNPPFIKYQQGKENALVSGLRFVINDIESSKQQEEEARQEKQEKRKEELLERGQQLLDEKEYVRARAYLRRVAEAYGDEPGVISDVGKRLLKAGQHQEAASVFKEAISRFPSDSMAYAFLVQAFMEDRQFEQAERVYMMAVRQFGPHSKTYLGLAKLYIEWRKHGKAYDYLTDALSLDPELEEAKELLAEVEKRVFIQSASQRLA